MNPNLTDFGFRATGGNKVTTGIDQAARASYQARMTAEGDQ